jgi:hypothetical protein
MHWLLAPYAGAFKRIFGSSGRDKVNWRIIGLSNPSQSFEDKAYSPMNIREDLKQLKTDKVALRNFGLVVGGVFALLGALFWWKQKSWFPYFLWPGAILMVWGVVWARGLKWVYRIWMGLAFVLGFIMAHVILTLLFLLVITPMGWLARLTGKDFLSLKLDRAARSYWLPRTQRARSAADYERQF